MYRFKLNDNLKKYIREVEVVRDKVQVVGNYLRELEYECDITISIGGSEFKFNGFIVIPDWEAQCFRIDKKDRGKSFNQLKDLFNLKNAFGIPFSTVLEGYVKFVTTWHGKMNLTNKFIELIENAYNNELVGYRYEFIPEVWEGACKINRVYSINGKFYRWLLPSVMTGRFSQSPLTVLVSVMMSQHLNYSVESMIISVNFLKMKMVY